MATISVNSGGSTTGTASPIVNHKVIAWVAAIVLCLILWQVKSLQTPLRGVLLIVGFALLVKNYATIRQQFSSIGN